RSGLLFSVKKRLFWESCPESASRTVSYSAAARGGISSAEATRLEDGPGIANRASARRERVNALLTYFDLDSSSRRAAAAKPSSMAARFGAPSGCVPGGL